MLTVEEHSGHQLRMAITASANEAQKREWQLCCAENFPVFSPVRRLIQKLYLASDEAVKKLLALFLRHDIYRGGVQIWRVWCPLFLLNHLQTVRVQALLSDTSCVHRATCISLKSVAVFSKIWKQKLINNSNFCMQLKLNYSGIIVVSSWY